MAFLSRYQDDPTPPSVSQALKDLLVRAVLPALVLWAAIAAFGWLLVQGPLADLGRREEAINDALAARRTSLWNTISMWWSGVGNTLTIIVTAVIVAGIVWWVTRKWWVAVIPLIAIALQSSVFVTATWLTDRQRPTVEKLDPAPPTSSYPSGHEGATTALYMTVILLATRIRNPVLRWLIIVVAAAMPAIVAFARVYRGMHHVTDVSVGIINGTVCGLLAWGYLRRDPTATKPPAR